MISFSIAPSLAATLAAVCGFPVILAAISRLVKGKNSLQFLIVALVVVTAWFGLLVQPTFRPANLEEVVTASMAFGGAMLVYLEIWALLSRGYTISVLITLHESDRPLDANDIAGRYRGGDGLEWIIRHRLSGLAGAGLVHADGQDVKLTRLGGVVADGYRLAIGLLGLKRTG